MKIVTIDRFRFAMNLGPGTDSWLPYGEVNGHPGFKDGECIFTSSPVDFDEEMSIMKTASGRYYLIKSFDTDGGKDKWLTELKQEITKNKAIIAKRNENQI